MSLQKTISEGSTPCVPVFRRKFGRRFGPFSVDGLPFVEEIWVQSPRLNCGTGSIGNIAQGDDLKRNSAEVQLAKFLRRTPMLYKGGHEKLVILA